MDTTILIVEDTPETLELLKRIVEKGGFSTILANDGEKGLDYARRFKPNLVILDRLLPGMNGLQICREIRRNGTLHDTAVIFLSVLDSEKDIVEGLRAGADDYLTKPFSPDELMARIGRILSRYAKFRES